MIPCDDIDLVGYIEGQASEEVRCHLETCAACRKKLAQVRTIIGALVDAAWEDDACTSFRERALDRVIDGETPDQEHLDACPACREFYQAAVDALGWTEKKSPLEWAPLPDKVRQMAAERHRQWMKSRLEKVISLQGVKDDRTKKDQLDQMLDDSAEDLPRAAFPDDLADTEDKEDD